MRGRPGLPAALFGEGAAGAGGREPSPTWRPETARLPRPRQAWLAGVDPLLDAYFALEDPRLLEPEAREQLVEVELESGLLLRGYVDRIDAAGGRPRGSSTTRPAPLRGPRSEARALFQMKFYALVLLLLRGSAPRELCLMYLTGPETLHYVPDAEQLLRFGRTLEAMWTAIRSAGATGDFRPNPGPSCAWCSHRALCPAWDGVPPPYPGWPADPGVAGADPARPRHGRRREAAVRAQASRRRSSSWPGTTGCRW